MTKTNADRPTMTHLEFDAIVRSMISELYGAVTHRFGPEHGEHWGQVNTLRTNLLALNVLSAAKANAEATANRPTFPITDFHEV